MRPFLFSFCLISSVYAYAQDSSDILYIKTEDVDRSHIGRTVQFDFYQRSFHGNYIDTLEIMIDNHPVRFIEVRNDNGHVNLFEQQYLKAIDYPEGNILRIPKLKLVAIRPDSFIVIMYVNYYRTHTDPLPIKTSRRRYQFLKRIVHELLVSGHNDTEGENGH